MIVSVIEVYEVEVDRGVHAVFSLTNWPSDCCSEMTRWKSRVRGKSLLSMATEALKAPLVLLSPA